MSSNEPISIEEFRDRHGLPAVLGQDALGDLDAEPTRVDPAAAHGAEHGSDDVGMRQLARAEVH